MCLAFFPFFGWLDFINFKICLPSIVENVFRPLTPWSHMLICTAVCPRIAARRATSHASPCFAWTPPRSLRSLHSSNVFEVVMWIHRRQHRRHSSLQSQGFFSDAFEQMTFPNIIVFGLWCCSPFICYIVPWYRMSGGPIKVDSRF